ncbi:hypothetical protein GCM10009105_15530 [Dokdonella soli]|uniref:Serine/threonine protein kinase n=2 Tax=Dokdonella soli TaxID=529810 RepID=A0ABN1IGE7_9GAMM
MELDDLKLAWQTLDRRLQQQNALGLQLFRDGRVDKARRGLRPLVWGQAIQMLIGVLGSFWFAPFWVAHRHEPWLLLAGLVMHVYCLGLIVFGAVMQARIARIDYAAPVLAIQRQLLTLRRTYVIGGLLIGLPWWFLTAPLLVVLTRGLILDNAPSAVWGQLVVGAIGLLATGGFVRWANQPHRAALGRKLGDGAAGGSIHRAQAALDEIARFEKE